MEMSSLMIHDRLADITNIVREDTMCMKTVSVWYKDLMTRVSTLRKINAIEKLHGWQAIPSSVYKNLDNGVDEVFVNLIYHLIRGRYEYSAVSLHRLWVRLVSTGQQHLISYLRMSDLPKDRLIVGTDLLQLCYKGADGLETFNNWLNRDDIVDIHIRELLGISMNHDVRSAYMKWVASNHPDKGGDNDKFAEYNTVYQEWKSLYEKEVCK